MRPRACVCVCVMIRHVEKVKGEVEAYIGAFDVDFFSEKSIPIIARFYLIPKTKEARAFYPLLSLSLSLSLSSFFSSTTFL